MIEKGFNIIGVVEYGYDKHKFNRDNRIKKLKVEHIPNLNRLRRLEFFTEDIHY